MRELSPGAAQIAALLLAGVLALLHLLAPRLRQLRWPPESVLGSVAGGLAVSYVFLHLLPELALGNEFVGSAVEDLFTPTPVTELAIFFVALAGFTLLLGAQRLAGRLDARARDRGGGSPDAYRIQVASFALYNGLITYTMPLRLQSGLLFGMLFTLAIGLHFVVTDRTLEAHEVARFRRTGRLVLVAALFAGWAVAAVAPVSLLAASLWSALLAGAVLMNVFKEEIPTGRRSSFPAFVAGLLFYAVLLVAVTVAERS